MSVFDSEKNAEEFKKQLIYYFSQKKEHDIAKVLNNSTLSSSWFSYDNWGGDIYNLILEVPMDTYIKLENNAKDLTTKIIKISNNLIKGDNQIRNLRITTKRMNVDAKIINQNPIHDSAMTTLSKLDSDSIHQRWEKAVNRLNGDLDGAITAASTLLEGTIKHILNDTNVDYSDENDDLPKLYKLLAKKLNLSPSQHHEEIFKQILGGCHSIVQGLGSLRNKIGDAHASGKRSVKPDKRHAELAVNLAGSMATFLIATWENTSPKKIIKN